jgi:hypothetical protein
MRAIKSSLSLEKVIRIVGLSFSIFSVSILFFSFTSGLKHSYFFADDFLGLALFRDAQGLLNLEASAGRPITNIYFFIATKVFGGSENTPFLISNFLLLIIAFVIFMASEIKRIQAWPTGTIYSICLLIGSGSLYPLVFWASNFNHVFCIFLFSTITLLYRLNTVTQDERLIICQSILYLVLISSNPLFSPLLLTGLVTLVLDFKSSKSRGTPRMGLLVLNTFVRVFLPVLYILTISLPFLFNNSQYRLGLFESFLRNVRFYSTLDGCLLGLVLTSFSIVLFHALYLTVQRKNFEQLSYLTSGLVILTIVLVQEEQQGLHYLIIPILILVPILVQNLCDKFVYPVYKLFLLSILSVILVFTFLSGSSIRSYFSNTPWGSNLTNFNNEVIKMNLSEVNVCVKGIAELDDWTNFIAQIGGANFFLRKEIGAKSVVFVVETACPKNLDGTTVLVSKSDINTFVATRE